MTAARRWFLLADGVFLVVVGGVQVVFELLAYPSRDTVGIDVARAGSSRSDAVGAELLIALT